MEANPRPPVEGEISLPEPENQEVTPAEQQIEVVPEKVLLPKTVVIEGMKQNADVALAHAIESADEPVEGRREKRAEIRDDKAEPVVIGNILADRPSPPRQQPVQETPKVPLAGNQADAAANSQPQPAANSASAIRSTGLPYKKSIISGFMAAILLLIFWMLLQLIF